MSVLLFLGAAALAGVLIWQKAMPKLVAVLALVVGINLSGWIANWIHKAVSAVAHWLSGPLGHLTGKAPGLIAAAVPAVIGLVLLVIVVTGLWPKKGKASTLTAGAALVLPLLWPAFMAGVNQVSASAGA